MLETVAMQGRVKRLNVTKQKAFCGDVTTNKFVSDNIDSVDKIDSFAEKPNSVATANCHFPKPRGAKIQQKLFPIEHKILFSTAQNSIFHEKVFKNHKAHEQIKIMLVVFETNSNALSKALEKIVFASGKRYFGKSKTNSSFSFFKKILRINPPTHTATNDKK